MSSGKTKIYSPDKSYKVGEVIEHNIYGIGTVTDAGKTEGGHDRMTVKFNILGEMTMAMNFTPVKVEEKA